MKITKVFPILILFIAIFTLRVYAQEYNLSAEALFNFGKAYLETNNYTDAKIEFEKCLMLNPRHAEAKKLLQLCEKKISPAKDKAIEAALDEAAKKLKPEPKPEPEENTLQPPVDRVTWTLKQGTWNLKQGEFYGELYNKYYWHEDKFDDNGKKKKWDYEGKGNEIRTELKLEYGLTDRYTLMLYTVAKEAHWKDSFKSCTTKGFVEMWPGIKYLLFEEPFFVWLRARGKFPLHYSEEAVPALGTHQIDGEFKILTAQPWPKLPGYTKFELGFKGRNEEPTNEIIYFSQLGYNLTENLILELSLDGQEGLAQTGGIDEDWTKYTVGPIFKVGLLNIKFGYGNTFAGKNTSAADEIYLSVYTWW